MSQHKRKEQRNRFLTLLGLLIVFATFILKNGLSENYKDLLSSIERAQNLFGLRQDIAFYYSRPTLIPPSDLAETKQRVDDMRKEAMSILNGAIDLAQKVSSDYRRRVQAQFNRTASVFAEITERLGRLQLADPQTAANTRQLYEQAAAALRQASDARVILNVDAKLLAEKRKTQYDAAKWASYIFYALGWVLTFYGHLSSKGHPVPSAL